MYEDRYTMTAGETRHLTRLQQEMAEEGGLWKRNKQTGDVILNSAKLPIAEPFIALRGSPNHLPRFCIDSHGVVWKFRSPGMDKCPHLPDGGGTKYIKNYVEMWNGKWRKIPDPNNPGQMTYAKFTLDQSVDCKVMGFENMPVIEYMRLHKGYKHPFDEPQRPSDAEIAAMEGRLKQRAPVILAQMREAVMADKTIKNPNEVIAEAEANMARTTQPVEGMAGATAPAPAPLVMAPTEAAPPVAEEPKATEQARTFADEHDIDLATVTGSGSNGRIVRSDVTALVPELETVGAGERSNRPL